MEDKVGVTGYGLYCIECWKPLSISINSLKRHFDRYHKNETETVVGVTKILQNKCKLILDLSRVNHNNNEWMKEYVVANKSGHRINYECPG